MDSCENEFDKPLLYEVSNFDMHAENLADMDLLACLL